MKAFKGRSSDGRHTTQSSVRSALTAGPCSNSLFRHPVFRFTQNHPMHRPAEPSRHQLNSHLRWESGAPGSAENRPMETMAPGACFGNSDTQLQTPEMIR